MKSAPLDPTFEYMMRSLARWYFTRSVNKKGFYRSFRGAVEKPFLEAALEVVCGNQLKAARMLGLNRNTLHAHLKRFKINPQKYREFL